MKKTAGKIKSLTPLFLLVLAVIQVCTLFFLLSLFSRINPDKKQINTLIEAYLDKQNYSAAEALAVNMLVRDPADPDAALWIEKIHAEKARLAPEAQAEVGDRAGDDQKQRTANDQLAALRNLKRSIDEMKAARNAPIVINNPVDLKTMEKKEKEQSEAAELERFFQAGLAAYQSGNYLEAKDNLKKVLAVDPDNPQANSYLGATLFDENPQNEEQLKGAIQYCKKALDGDKSNKLAYVTLAKIYETRGNRELAVANYQEALSIDPNDARLHLQAGRLQYQLHEYAKATNSLRKAVKLDDNLPFAYYYLGLMSRETGDPRQALAHFSDAIKLDDRFSGAYGERGEIKFGLDDYAGAAVDFHAALGLNDSFIWRARLGDCCLKTGKKDAALAEYRTALDRTAPSGATERKKAAEIFCLLADSYEKKNDTGEAYRIIHQAISARFELPELYLIKGRIEAGRKETALAIESYQRVIGLDPGSVDGCCELALLYKRSGRTADADNLMREFTGRNPGLTDSPKVVETIKTLKK